MNKGRIKNSLILLLTAFIWGVAFVAQDLGGDAAGPYAFNCARSLIGAVVLVPVIFLLRKKGYAGEMPRSAADWKPLIAGGVCCGIVLFAGSTLQQLGLYCGATPGKAGFLTSCYILIVPVLGIFLKKKCGWNVWTGILAATAGLYLLCCPGGTFRLKTADILLLLCALAFSIHILIIDYFSPRANGIIMSCLQFLVCGILSAVPAAMFDMPDGGWRALFDEFSAPGAWISVLYAGVISCGAGYTLQIIGQKGINPAIASLLMSFESVFSVLAGWVILGDSLTIREICGCVLMFFAIVLAQIPFAKKSRVQTPSD